MQYNHIDKAVSSLRPQSKQISESDAKEFRKKLRNRQSAQRARDRQKARMRWLEQRVEILNVKNQQLQNENNILRSCIADGAYDSRLNTICGKGERDSSRTDVKMPRRHLSRSPVLSYDSASDKKRTKVAGTGDDKCIGAIERVAVISPISRSKPKSPFEWSVSPLAQHLNAKADCNQFSSPTKHSGENPSSYFKSLPESGVSVLGSHIFDLPLATQMMRNKYATILPYFLCPTAYTPNLALLNVLPSTMTARFHREGIVTKEVSVALHDEQRGATQAKYDHPDTYTSGSQPIDRPVMLPAAESFIHASMRSIEVQKTDRKSLNKRHKMNSFESECSSQMSVEADEIIQSS